MKQDWRLYFPAIILFLLGAFTFIFPKFVAYLFALALVCLGIFYAWLVNKFMILESTVEANWDHLGSFEREVFSQGRPSLSRVVVTVMKDRDWP